MASFTNVVEINRPAHEVFAFLANLENVPRWNYAITETRKTSPGEVGVGTTYEQTRSIPTPSREHLTLRAGSAPDRRRHAGAVPGSAPVHRRRARRRHASDQHGRPRSRDRPGSWAAWPLPGSARRSPRSSRSSRGFSSPRRSHRQVGTVTVVLGLPCRRFPTRCIPR
jgi:Polyketide cyclase / dehydrase and lipid transport